MHALLESTLLANVPLFDFLLYDKPRRTLDTLVLLMGELEQGGGAHTFVEQRQQMLLEVRYAVEKRHRDCVTFGRFTVAKIAWSSAGLMTKRGDLLLVNEADGTVHRSRYKESSDTSGGQLRNKVRTVLHR